MSKMIDPYLIHFIKNEPFFTTISQNLEKRETSSIPTACVGFNESGKMYLAYNPEFIKDLDFHEVIGVLKHEFLHIVFLHLTNKRLAGFKNEDQHKFFNVAADLAINSFIEDELPDMGVFAGTDKGGEKFSDWPKKKSAENYLNRIRNMDEEDQEDLDGEALDIHDWFGDMNETERAMAEENMKGVLEKAQENAVQESWGSVPEKIKDRVETSLSHSEVDWRKVIRQFITTITSEDRFSSVRRPNRKYFNIHPGNRRERKPKIAVSVDQSGSISDENLSDVASELNKLAELVKFVVIPHDTTYNEDTIFTWDQGEKFKEIDRVHRGGTDLAPNTKYVNENNFEGHIMFTDMEAQKPPRSNCKRIYIVPPGSNPRFETKDKVIRLDKRSEV